MLKVALLCSSWQTGYTYYGALSFEQQTLFSQIFCLVAFIEQKENDNNDNLSKIHVGLYNASVLICELIWLVRKHCKGQHGHQVNSSLHLYMFPTISFKAKYLRCFNSQHCKFLHIVNMCKLQNWKSNKDLTKTNKIILKSQVGLC